MLFKKRAQCLVLSIAMLSVFQMAWSVPNTSDFKKDMTDEYYVDRLFNIKKTANKLLCLIAQLDTEALAGKGLYSVIFDPSSCDIQRPGDEQEGSFFEVADKSYMRGVVQSDRLPTGACQVKAWIAYPSSDPDPLARAGMGFEQRLYLSALLESKPTILNPLGVMRTDFCLAPIGQTGLCGEGGFIMSTQENQSFYTYFSQNKVPLALLVSRMMENDTRPYEGYGIAEMGDYTLDTKVMTTQIRGDFDFNKDFLKMTDPDHTLADICYDRNVARSAPYVFDSRMGLYDVTTGQRIFRNFAAYLTYTSGSTRYTGVIDDDGVWFPDVLTLPRQGQVSIRGQSGTYTFDIKSGFLSRRHHYARPLEQVGALDMYIWIDPSNVVDPQTLARLLPPTFVSGFYSMHWDRQKQQFILKYIDPTTMKLVEVSLTIEQVQRMWLLTGWIPTSYGSNNLFTSMALVDHKGQRLTPDQIMLEENQMNLMYPDAPIFTSGEVLYCIHDCPTAQAIQAGTYFDPATMNPAGSPVSSVRMYRLKDGLLEDMAGHPMVVPQSAARTAQFITGPLLTKQELSHLDSHCVYPSGFKVKPSVGYCVSELNLVQDSVVWESGNSFWNQYIGLRDTAGQVAHVQSPLYYFYDVPSTMSSPLAGTTVLLRQSRDSVLSEPVSCLDLLTNQPTVCTNRNTVLGLYNYYDIPGTEGPASQLRMEDGGRVVLYKPLRTGRIFKDVPAAGCIFQPHLPPEMPTLAGWHNPATPPYLIGEWKKPEDYPVRVVDGELMPLTA